MKILNILKEQEEDNQMRGITIDGGSYGYTFDTLNKIEQSIKSSGGFVYSNDTIYHPSGDYRMIPTLMVDRRSDTELRLAVKMYLMINGWEIPKDFLIFITEWMIGQFKKNISGIEEMITDTRFLNGSIHYSIKDIFVAKGDVFFSLEEYMDTMYYNSHIMRVYPLDELFNPQKINEVYSLDPSQVPTFSDDFSLATDRVTKKVKHVYKGFRKGTYKGHQYEYKENNPRISVLIEKDDYDPTTKVIHPKFRIQLNAGYVWIDGKPTSSFEPEVDQFKDKDFVIEFDYYIKERFKQFGIKLL